MTITCYPQPGKFKSRQVLEAFALGCGASVTEGNPPPVLHPGPAAFYGAVGLEHLVREALHVGHEFWYGDNAFFDQCRGTHYRFARNAFQVHKQGAPDHDRLKRMGVKVKPWQTDGEHVVVCEQSEHFLRLCGAGHDWLRRVLDDLSLRTDRRVVVRRWNADKGKLSATLPEDLKGAWALVTHTSAAAVTALLQGVPVFTSGLCGATPLASGPLSNIETPRRSPERDDWAAWLAAQQWTIPELKDGTAWRMMTA